MRTGPPNIGEAPNTTERDAIHVAVIPVEAGCALTPGQKVIVLGGVAHPIDDGCTGVVDPYRKVPVATGDRFWLFLQPGTITSLHHEWSHPDFPSAQEEGARAESERWLRAFAEEHRIEGGYEALIEGAASGNGAKFGHTDYQEYIDADLWGHVEVVTGRRFSESHREGAKYAFYCGC